MTYVVWILVASNDLPLIYLICSKTNHQRQVLKSVYREVFDSVRFISLVSERVVNVMVRKVVFGCRI